MSSVPTARDRDEETMIVTDPAAPQPSSGTSTEVRTGADPEIANAGGWTPLHCAAYSIFP